MDAALGAMAVNHVNLKLGGETSNLGRAPQIAET
jgi:hypothetical protein